MKYLKHILAILILAELSMCSADNHAELLFNIDHTIQQEKNETQLILDSILISTADKILELPPPEFNVVGRRLLGTSRIYLKRLSYLGYAFQITGNQQYASKSGELMLASASFPHWNPSHYLDVAEMTMALAIGLSWTREGLSEKVIQEIEEAIINMGLLPSVEEPRGFLTNTNNWNQVCNASLAIGAMAVYHRIPELADFIIYRTKKNISIPEALYAPDGVYPEGCGYWEYGTSFHILFLDAYRNFYPDSSLIISDALLKSKDFIYHVSGPGGAYNYCDNTTNLSLSSPFIWISAYTGDYSTFSQQKKYLVNIIEERNVIEAEGGNFRLFPFALLWLKSEMLETKEANRKLNWSGQGVNPVSFHRSGWKDTDVFLAVKGGAPGISHGHMDVGSFILDAKAKRWVMDLGRHDYHSLENQGIGIWDNGQEGERWKVFRYTNFSHSTLVIDNHNQLIDGTGRIIEVKTDIDFQSTLLDITEVYSTSIKQVQRRISLIEGTMIRVSDSIVNNENTSKVRWAFPTVSIVEIVNEKKVNLIQGEEFITVKLVSPTGAKFQTYSAQPDNDFEDKNPGVIMLGFDYTLAPNQKTKLEVDFNLE